MELSGGAPFDGGSAEEEITPEAAEVIRAEVTAAIKEQKAAETVYDLIQQSWMLDAIVDRAMTSLEGQGIVITDEQIAEIVTATIAGLLPEGTPYDPPPEPGDGYESGGVREPRRPLPSTDSGTIDLELPRKAA